MSMLDRLTDVKKSTYAKIIAVLVSIAMVLSLTNMSAFAEGDGFLGVFGGDASDTVEVAVDLENTKIEYGDQIITADDAEKGATFEAPAGKDLKFKASATTEDFTLDEVALVTTAENGDEIVVDLEAVDGQYCVEAADVADGIVLRATATEQVSDNDAVNNAGNAATTITEEVAGDEPADAATTEPDAADNGSTENGTPESEGDTTENDTTEGPATENPATDTPESTPAGTTGTTENVVTKAFKGIEDDETTSFENSVNQVYAVATTSFTSLWDNNIQVLADQTYSVYAGSTMQIRGSQSENGTHSWSVVQGEDRVDLSDTSSRTVNIEGLKAGTAIIQHTYYVWEGFLIWGQHKAYTQQYEIEVLAVPSEIKIDPQAASIEVGQTCEFQVTTDIDNAAITWTTADANIAIVDQNGKVTGKGIGTTTITATTINGLAASATVVVSRDTSKDATRQAYFYLVYPGVSNPDQGKFNPGNWLYAGKGQATLPENSDTRITANIDNLITSAATDFESKTITIEGTTYSYDPNGTTPNSYSVVWDRATWSDGSTNSNKWDGESGQTTYFDANGNEVNYVTSPKAWHIDGHLVINDINRVQVGFYVQQPGEAEFQLVNGGGDQVWPRLVAKGTKPSSLVKPNEQTVPATVNQNGTNYYFDGWYTDHACINKADFSEDAAELNANIQYFGKYIAEVTYAYQSVDTTQGTVDKSSEVIAPNSSVVPSGSTATAAKGYKLEGWYSDSALTNKVSEEDHFVPSAIDGKYQGGTFYAKFAVDQAQTKDLTATVNYYLNGVLDSKDTTSLKKTVQILVEDATISTAEFTPKQFTGYTLQKVEVNNQEQASAVIPVNVNNGDVINYYFVPSTYNVVVNYVDEDGNKVAEPYSGTVNYDGSYNVQSPSVTGMTPDKASVSGSNVKENVAVTVTYTKLHNLTLWVNHYRLGTTEKIAQSDIIKNLEFGSPVNGQDYTKDITGYSYNSCSPSDLKISTGTGNVINLYYAPKTTYSYTIKYVDVDEPNKEIKDSLTFENQAYGTIVNAKSNVAPITGYQYDSVDKETITVGVSNPSEITIFYKKDLNQTKKLAYTIKHQVALNSADTNPEVRDIDTVTKDIWVNDSDVKVDDIALKTYEGYTYGVNSHQLNLGDAVLSGDAKVSNGNEIVVTYYANPSTIHFNTNGGIEVNDMNGLVGQIIDQSAMPTTSKEGFVFAGWYEEADFSGFAQGTLPDKYPVNEKTYYARWISADGINRIYAGQDINNQIAVNGFDPTCEPKIFKQEADGTKGTEVENKFVNVNQSGTYIVEVSKGTYTYTITGVSVEITPAPITIVANDDSKMFGEKDNASYNGSVVQGTVYPNDEIGTVAYQRTNAEINDAGYYEGVIAPSVAEADQNSNYLYIFENGNYTIRPADSNNVTAESITKTYDAQEAAVSGQAAIEGSTVEYSVDGVNYTSESPRFANVGTYTVYVRATLDNYEPVTTTARVVINPAPVTVTVNDATKTVATDDPEFSAVVEGLFGDDTIDYTIARPGVGTDEAVGVYQGALVATGETTQGNYVVNFVPGDFTITAPVPANPANPGNPGGGDGTPVPTPVPGVPADGPAAALAPVAAALAAPVTALIGDDETPLAEEAIGDEEDPLAAFDHVNCWVHYYMILGILLTLVYGGCVIARRSNYSRKIQKMDDYATGKAMDTVEETENVANAAAQKMEA